MLRKTLGLLILLAVMLNHAVVACDAMVMHLPDHDHAYTSLNDNHSNSIADNADHHSEHAHVTCHIAFFHGIDLLNFSDSAIIDASQAIRPISYRPPVPPPNS
ncbi:hypothetical protein [Rheinheimera baltica]|uniref:hypothetical protein n=1 Tax=Rheinheimera baltica TaxID=67576 RepID=UPI0003F4C662|nr:hypothetical protein [Rheinheimera baltica]MDP5144459.1 cobalt transporter [Rheinheimera baltica]MDP5149063.1 cobalt transporter [Rheinheimera baltica]MDP5189691.1 cobalt transporter [Rheinheimera baltica]